MYITPHLTLLGLLVQLCLTELCHQATVPNQLRLIANGAFKDTPGSIKYKYKPFCCILIYI